MKTYMEQCQQPLTGSTSSGVAIEWDHTLEPGSVGRALFVFTEVATGNQTRHEVLPKFRTCISLIAGPYQVAVFAQGLERYRGLLEVGRGFITQLSPVLNPSNQEAKTLKDIVAKFDIDKSFKTRDLDVPKNTTAVLHMDDPQYKPDWKVVEIKDVGAAKRVIGHSDNLWPGTMARFNQLVLSPQANPETIARQAAHEYVYGNSTTVKQWEGAINEAVFDESWRFPLFIFKTVTINAGGVLVIGDKGNFFTCENLRMHVTATLLIRGSGPIHVEPVTLETFC